jgi:hypothetical protein
MITHFLTKSDFKVAQTCPTKLYYRKLGYPTREDGDEYLAALADQGYLVEALARALYPDGRWVGYRDDVESAAWDTMTALAPDACTLFEATFISGSKMARARHSRQARSRPGTDRDQVLRLRSGQERRTAAYRSGQPVPRVEDVRRAASEVAALP